MASSTVPAPSPIPLTYSFLATCGCLTFFEIGMRRFVLPFRLFVQSAKLISRQIQKRGETKMKIHTILQDVFANRYFDYQAKACGLLTAVLLCGVTAAQPAANTRIAPE